MLTRAGIQTALMWVGYVGYFMLAPASYGPHARAGGWVGIAGSLIIATAGVVALRASSTGADTLPPAGWYADPTGEGRLRYWSGVVLDRAHHDRLLGDRRQEPRRLGAGVSRGGTSSRSTHRVATLSRGTSRLRSKQT